MEVGVIIQREIYDSLRNIKLASNINNRTRWGRSVLHACRKYDVRRRRKTRCVVCAIIVKTKGFLRPSKRSWVSLKRPWRGFGGGFSTSTRGWMRVLFPVECSRKPMITLHVLHNHSHTERHRPVILCGWQRPGRYYPACSLSRFQRRTRADYPCWRFHYGRLVAN